MREQQHQIENIQSRKDEHNPLQPAQVVIFRVGYVFPQHRRVRPTVADCQVGRDEHIQNIARYQRTPEQYVDIGEGEQISRAVINRHLPTVNVINSEKERTDDDRREEKNKTSECKESRTQNLNDVACSDSHPESSDNEDKRLEKGLGTVQPRIDRQPEND